MKFIHYSVDDIYYIGVIKDNKIYRTEYSNIEELFDVDLSTLKLELEKEDIKEEPIIKYPHQDILCLGMNYLEHKKECIDAGFDNSKEKKAVYFSKRCNQAITNLDIIDLHQNITSFVDYEGELGIVLKKDAYNLKNDEEINDVIFGYCIINDVSARDLQKEHQQFYFGKSLDTFTSISSVLVTKDEFDIYPSLNIKTYVNDELRQNDNTNNMIYTIGNFMKEITSGMTLLSGTIIATGTPSGVGKSLNKPLKKNDVVKIEIESIGTLINMCE